MPRKKTTDYDNTSITTLKGADRVRKRPAEFPLTTTKTKSATTGNWFSANSMPAVSIITTRVKATNFPLV